MKRIVTAFLLAGLLFGLSFFAGDYLKESCSYMSDELEVCAEKIKAQEYEKALFHIEGLQAQWQKNITLLSIVSGDDMLIGPGKNIPAIYDSVRDENYDSALMLIRECQGYFEEVIESQRLSIGNIL